ncbi:MAG: hypothetical protein HOP11_12870 [Saprospiraceae bacterium]|nr:hypothetical protein [Saprospiraceae bacterium]
MKFFKILLLGCLQILTAQESSFRINTSLDTVYLGNYLEVKFTIENTKGKFKEPSFAGLKVISGPNTYSSMKIMNGESTSSMTYSYIVKPAEVGNYIIEPATLETEDETLKTTEKKIVVLPNPDNILQSPAENDQNPFDVLVNPRQEKAKPKKKIYKI